MGRAVVAVISLSLFCCVLICRFFMVDGVGVDDLGGFMVLFGEFGFGGFVVLVGFRGVVVCCTVALPVDFRLFWLCTGWLVLVSGCWFCVLVLCLIVLLVCGCLFAFDCVLVHGLSLGLVGLWFWLDLGCGGMLRSCLSGGFSIVLVMCWLVDFVFRFVGFVFWFCVWLFCWFVVDRFCLGLFVLIGV